MRSHLVPGFLGACLPLLLLLLPCSSGRLDEPAARAVLAEAMRCQGLRQLHAAAVQAGRTLLSVQLELLPNATVADVDRQVLLPLASVSKGMFATVLPLVQQQLRKDREDPGFDLLTRPIKQLLGDSDFWFLDHVRTDSVTLEDLTSHTTGLSRHDALSVWSGIRAKEELARLAGRFNATETFRGSFVYNNLAWTVADVAVEKLIGKNFSTYMRQFLWQPLGMSGTVASSELEGRANFERTELERSIDVVEAAGGIYAPLQDMVKYMQYYTGFNYSNLPANFKSVNAFTTGSRPYDARLLNESVTDLPDIDRESYGYGWQRSWYRDNLQYDHGGVFFGAHCHLRVLSKRRLSVFTHSSLAPSDSAYQSAYTEILNHYLADMLLRNASFVTRDNVCSLFRKLSPEEPVAVPKRALTPADLEAFAGSFGNYGFGEVSVSLNSTSGLLNVAYGVGALEMVPVQLPHRPDGEFSFFLTILRPAGFPVAPAIVGSNDSHVMLSPGSVSRPPQQQQWAVQTPLFARIWRQSDGGGIGGGRVVMVTPSLDATAVLEKGLRPESWRRPELCPSGRGAQLVGLGPRWTLATAALVVVAAAAA